MADVLSTQVLVINRLFQAVHITSARRALVLLWSDIARAMDESLNSYAFDEWLLEPVRARDRAVGTSRGPLRVPRIVQLGEFDRMPRATVRLTRRNIFLRDAHTCQYCGRHASTRDLNLDHVHPRSRGGPMSWENVVCSCRSCNLRKGGRTPAEANMRLLRAPTRPRWSPILAMAFSPSRPPEWDPFLSALPGARELSELWASAQRAEQLAESA